MAKKRGRETEDGVAEGKRKGKNESDMDDSSDDEDFDVVNVDFEWFNFDPEIDFHGVRTLLRQLLDTDAALLDLSRLTDLVIQQRTIGSAVKVDGEGSDAYAFLTVLNLRELLADGGEGEGERKDARESVASLVRYVVDRARNGGVSDGAGEGGNRGLARVAEVLESDGEAAGTRVGLVLADRLINMPAEVAPPMFSMLVDEIEAAVEDGEPYEFTHYLLLSKTYREVQPSAEVGDGAERKAKKAKESSSSGGAVFYFHPEDEVLQRHAVAYGSYEFKKEDENVADSKRAFQDMGIKSFGSMILIEATKFVEAVQAVADYLGTSSA